MTTLNTIIEEEKKEFEKLYLNTHWMRLVTSEDLKKESEPLEQFLTTAMQRAYEAGVQNTLTKVIDTTNGQPGEIEYSQNPRDAFTTGWQQATAQYRTQVQSLLKEISH